MWQSTSHGSRSHYPAPLPRLALIVFIKALTCFLMWFGEWLAAGHSEQPTWRPNPHVSFTYCSPKNQTSNKSLCPLFLPLVLPLLCGIFGHMFPSAPSAWWQICWAPTITGTQKNDSGLLRHSYFFFLLQRAVLLTLICGWIKNSYWSGQSFPSYPSRCWGHACDLIVTATALTAIDWKTVAILHFARECMYEIMRFHTHIQVRTQPERREVGVGVGEENFSNWLNYKSDYVSSRLVW